MPLGAADAKGTQLFFTDTGPVPSSTNYTTLVVIHGTSFNGGTFKRLPPLGLQRNIRTVLVNRREYKGSTPYTDDELAELNQGKKEFLERIGKELAYFLATFAESHNIPKASADLKSGGIALMGWSMGHHATMALLGHPGIASSDTYSKLEPYLRHFIMYDPPLTSLGYPIPTNGYHPFRDPAFETSEQRVANFGVWLSEYYSHPGFDSRSLADLDFREHGDNSSLRDLTPDDRAQILEKIPVDRVDLPLVLKSQQELGNQTKRALFDPDLAKSIFPDIPITYIECKSSNWYCVSSFFETERRVKELQSAGTPARNIKFVELADANHFVGPISVHMSPACSIIFLGPLGQSLSTHGRCWNVSWYYVTVSLSHTVVVTLIDGLSSRCTLVNSGKIRPF